MAIGKPIGTIYAELDLDDTKFTRAQKAILKEAGVVTTGVEKNYRTLGIKSAAIFDAMRDQAENAYQGIAHSSRSTADDIIRAEKAKNDKIKRLNDEQFGSQEKWFKKMSTGWSDLGRILVGAFSVRAMSNFTTELFEAGKEMAAIEMAFTSVTGSAAGTNAEFEFLRQLAKEAGQNFYDLTGVYKGFLAASKGTNLEGEKTRHVFESVTKAAASLGLTSDQTKGSLYAIQQMMSKGTVSSEELRQQLGERLPGAYNLMAEALGVTTKEMSKMLEQGQIAADEALPKLADLLEKRYPGGAAESVAATNKLAEAWMDLKVTLAKGGVEETFAKTMNFWAEQLGKLTGTMKATWLDHTKSQLDDVNSKIATLKDALNTTFLPQDSLNRQIKDLEAQARILAKTLENETNPALKRGAVEAEKEYTDLWISFADGSDDAFDRSIKAVEKWEKENQKKLDAAKKAEEKAAKDKEKALDKEIKDFEKYVDETIKLDAEKNETIGEQFMLEKKWEADQRKQWDDYNLKQDEKIAADKLEIMARNAKERQRVEETYTEGAIRAAKQLAAEQKTWGEYGAQSVMDAYDIMYDTTENVFYDALTGDLKSLADYADMVWDGIARSFASMAAEMVADYAATGLKGLLTGDGGSNLVSGIVGAAGGIWDAVDWMGSDLLGMWKEGAYVIAADQIAQLHKGEMVVPAEQAANLRAMIEASGGGVDFGDGMTGATGGSSDFAGAFGRAAMASAAKGIAGQISGIGSFDPSTAMTAGMLGGLSSVVSGAFNVTPDSRTQKVSLALTKAMSMISRTAALASAVFGPTVVDAVMDAMDARQMEAVRDALEAVSPTAFADFVKDMGEAGWDTGGMTGWGGFQGYGIGNPSSYGGGGYNSDSGGDRGAAGDTGGGDGGGIGRGGGSIGGLAMGGTAYAGTDYVIGEKGPEIFRPNVTGTVIPNDRIRVAEPAPMHLHINIDGREIAHVVANQARSNGELQNAFRSLN